MESPNDPHGLQFQIFYAIGHEYHLENVKYCTDEVHNGVNDATYCRALQFVIQEDLWDTVLNVCAYIKMERNSLM